MTKVSSIWAIVGNFNKNDALASILLNKGVLWHEPFTTKSIESMQKYNAVLEKSDSLAVTSNTSCLSRNSKRPIDKLFHMTMTSRIENISDIANSLVTYACRTPVENKVSLYLGIYELLHNAIEHGNFGIDWYRRQETLSQEEDLRNLYNARAKVAEREGKKVGIKFESNNFYDEFTVSDEGGGFDYKSHLRYVRSTVNNDKIQQRGILNCLMRFDELVYGFGGTVVRARKYHKISEPQF